MTKEEAKVCKTIIEMVVLHTENSVEFSFEEETGVLLYEVRGATLTLSGALATVPNAGRLVNAMHAKRMLP